MICPFRKETITIKTDVTESVKEIYCDCYENECPFYYYDYAYAKGEGCYKVDRESER